MSSGMRLVKRAGGEGELSDPVPGKGRVTTVLQTLLSPRVRRIFSSVYGNLLASSGAAPPRAVLVCSASEGEGVTTVSAGLAIAAADKLAVGRAGKGLGQVLLIDGNFHRPGVGNIFGVPHGKGLADLLLGGAGPDALTRKTTVPDLSIMRAGVVVGDHIRAMEPPKLRELLQELVPSYRFILIDGPAINAYPESILYAPQVDRVLLVVHSGVARGPVVGKALAKLSVVGCTKFEVILNRRRYAIPNTVYRRL